MPRHDVLCQCGWGRLACPEEELPDYCPVCGYDFSFHREALTEYHRECEAEFQHDLQDEDSQPLHDDRGI